MEAAFTAFHFTDTHLEPLYDKDQVRLSEVGGLNRVMDGLDWLALCCVVDVGGVCRCYPCTALGPTP